MPHTTLRPFFLLSLLLSLCFTAVWGQSEAEYRQLMVRLHPGAWPDFQQLVSPQDVSPAFAACSDSKDKTERTFPFQSFVRLSFSSAARAKAARQTLNQHPGVRYAEPVYSHQLQGTPPPPFIPSDPLVFQQWYLQKVRLPDVWDSQKGSENIVIAIIDAGVDQSHPDLVNKWYYNQRERYGRPGIDDDRNGYVDDSLGYDFASRSPLTDDDYYHGTAVSGIAAAETDNGEGMAGAGFRARLLPLKVTNLDPASGRIDLINLYEAMFYAAERGAKIINISGGRAGEFLQWEQDIIRYLVREKDVLIVAAAGNERFFSRQEGYFPASYDDVLAVTATDEQDYHLRGYNYSPFIDLSAPGANIGTTYNRSFSPFVAYSTQDNSLSLEGTSFSTPLVAGTAALLRAAFPDLNAVQVAALLRLTSDPIDHLPPNQSYREQIGKGRLNAFRAFEEHERVAAIQMDSFFISVPQTQTSLQLRPVLTNLLRPIQAGKARLSTNSPYAQVLKEQIELGDLNTLETTDTQAFELRFLAGTPKNTDVLFRLEFSDSAGYQDYQYFYVRAANPDFFHHDFNQIGLTLTSRGRLGFTASDYSRGKGLRQGGKNFLKEAGLLLGLPDGRVMDALMGDQDFRPKEPSPYLDEETVFRDRSYSHYTDAGAPAPFGLEVEETVLGRRNSPYQHYLALRYRLTNTGSQTLDSLQLGLFIDWFFEGAAEQSRWNIVEKFAYATDGDTYWGVQPLSNAVTSFQSLDANGASSWKSGFDDSRKAALLNGGLEVRGLSAADVAQLVAVSMKNIAPDTSREVTFLIAYGNSLSNMRLRLEQAARVFAATAPQSPVPSLYPKLCPTEQASTRVVPEGGRYFRLYTDENLVNPIQAGEAITISKADYGKRFYLTCTDSLVESDPLEVVFSEQPVLPDFIAPDTSDMTDTRSFVQFRDNSQTTPSQWHWDFGDGNTATIADPRHRYPREGLFEVSLTIEDEYGCRAEAEKEIQIVREGIVPLLPNRFSACAADSVVLRPSNGEHFRFYSLYPSEVIAEGRELVLRDYNLTRIWVTSLDSTLESPPAFASIRWNKLLANFDPSLLVDTLVSSEIQFTDRSTSEFPIVSREWNFGDGKTSQEQNPLHSYNQQGVYLVSLKVEDSRGCLSEKQTEFRVGKRAPVPLLPESQIACNQNPLEIKPAGGSQFRFYQDQDLSQLLHEGSTYVFTPTATTPRRLYITSVDSIIESYPATLDLILRSPTADFEFDRELFLDQSNQVDFQNLSSTALAWNWDFGDGKSSTQENPTHFFYNEGVYPITLTITTAEDCTASRTKHLTTFRRSPTPEIEDQLICQGDAATLRPEGGTHFRFFDSPFSDRPVYEGREYTTPFLYAPKTYYVTNTDSTLESRAKRVEINFSKPEAILWSEADTLNLRFDEGINLVSYSERSEQIYWDLGNGNVSNAPSVFATYEQTGTYDIQLIVRDLLGCLDTATTRLYVIDTLLRPLEPIPAGKDYLLTLFPNPSVGGLVTAQLQLREAAPVSALLYDTSGRLLYQSQVPDSLSVHRILLQTAKLPAGIYHLLLETPGQRIHHKVLRQ